MWILFFFINSSINILFPKSCFICKSKNYIICPNCLSNFSLNVDQPYSYISSYFSYKDNNIRKIIHSIKYYHRKDLIEPLVKTTLSKSLNLEPENYILIPIPIHWWRKLLRGYNQSELITKQYSKLTNIPYKTNILHRSKLTKRQVKSKNKNERIKNQINSFYIKTNDNLLENIKNKNIILIDDVTTTGSTINEARNILMKNGFKNVTAITLAH